MNLRVARTRHFLQLLPIRDKYLAANVVNRVLFAKRFGHACDARPVNAKHARYIFLRKVKFAFGASILQHQQPGAEPLFYRVMRIANDLLRDLFNIRIDLIVQPSLQRLQADPENCSTIVLSETRE